MNTVTFGGKEVETDFFVFGPNPNRIHTRLPKLGLKEAFEIAADESNLARVVHNGMTFTMCKFIAISSMADAPKLTLSYETMERTGG